MSPELLIKLKDLVFSPRNPYLSLDNLLQPYLDLMAECERETVERCEQLADEWGEGDSVGIPAGVFDERHGRHPHLAAALRSLIPPS